MSDKNLRQLHKDTHRRRAEAIATALSRTSMEAANDYYDLAWLREEIDFEAAYPGQARQSLDS